MVIDRENNMLELFQNGSLVSFEALENGDAVSDASMFPQRFRIGTREDMLPNNTFTGAVIDEVFVLPDAMPAAWVAAHYTNMRSWGRATIFSEVETKPSSR
jgi:hypothetical protein